MKSPVLIALLLAAIAVGFFAGRFRSPSRTASAREILYYVDPMHPSYRSSKPGVAPDCGMDLVPVYSDASHASTAFEVRDARQSIHINGVTQGLYGIQVTKVQRTQGVRTIRGFGKVVADETRVFRINLGTDGYVKTTTSDAVGTHITQNQRLAVVYSPEFLSVSGGYLSANERSPTASGKDANASAQNSASAQARADRLRNLGMSDTQIEEIGISRKIPEDVYVVSPVDGFILSRNISPGLRFERNTDLYTIADLRHVWVVAEIFGVDADAFHAGASIRVTLADTNEEFKARVSSVLPEVDPVSHSLKVRFEADNPNFKLRPEMLVSVELVTAAPTGLSVPAAAILDSGVSKRVFVEAPAGYFTPREVQTGLRFDDRIEIVKGLNEGELIASEGTFLIDSESRLEAATTSDKTGPSSKPSEMALGTPHVETHP
ncbi:efflux RND transporter periplasmic adaptor subunit [Acidicapsa acidisoli]|uniref:efflux RND transporter periplasmic adaptor subunit n=1 Tax=Acidicapsa acidisoli TaxID=1615681 RepID=UPI0021E05077|nr:efflux RND transporter periplasmic adaptor subunit [Acidicapsa acidisoli]